MYFSFYLDLRKSQSTKQLIRWAHLGQILEVLLNFENATP